MSSLSSSGPRRARDGERPDRAAEPLQVELADRLADATARRPRTPAARRGSARGRLRAEPGGEVRDAADRGVVGSALEPDPAERGVALGDADPEAEVVAAAAQPSASPPTRSRMATAIARPARRPVVARQRVVEEHHQPVAGEALERSLEAEDELAQRRVVLGQDGHDLLGLARLGEGA